MGRKPDPGAVVTSTKSRHKRGGRGAMSQAQRSSLRQIALVIAQWIRVMLCASLLWVGVFPGGEQAFAATVSPAQGHAFLASVPVPGGDGQPASWGLKPLQADTPTPIPTATVDPRLPFLMQQLDAAWNGYNWPEVLRLVDEIIAIDPNYDAIQEKHYYAHVNYGIQLWADGRPTEACEQFRQALQVRPSGEEALWWMTRYCPTPTPTPPPVTATPLPQPTATSSPVGPTPVPQIVTTPFTYTVQPGDTLYGLARRYSTTVQAIMQINGMMNYYLRAGQLIWIPASGSPSAGPIVHIVQPGETLFSIAQQYQTTVWAIMVANQLSSTAVWAYRALFIPSVTQPGPIIHIVMPGETLYTIATRYGTTVPLIMLANDLKAYELYVYQLLLIPPSGWSGWPSLLWPGPWPAGPAHPSTYVVQPGDTLYSIALRFGTTVEALKAANGLTSSMIRVGMVLHIP